MSRRNKFDTKDSLKLGDRAELSFKKIALKKGWKVTEATKAENIDNHWDYLIEKDLKSYKVDVKAMKRISRKNPTVQDTWFWVEFHGVRSLDKGWLYDGKADLIAVERKNSFLIVKRLDLIKLAEKLVDKKSHVHSAQEAKYKLYSRSGRPDLISMIEIDKLNEIKCVLWEKTH